jgi:hypothetical protein
MMKYCTRDTLVSPAGPEMFVMDNVLTARLKSIGTQLLPVKHVPA